MRENCFSHAIETITYVLAGTVDHGDSMGNRVLFDRADDVEVQAGDDGIRFLLVSGKPLQNRWLGTVRL